MCPFISANVCDLNVQSREILSEPLAATEGPTWTGILCLCKARCSDGSHKHLTTVLETF